MMKNNISGLIQQKISKIFIMPPKFPPNDLFMQTNPAGLMLISVSVTITRALTMQTTRLKKDDVQLIISTETISLKHSSSKSIPYVNTPI